MFSKSIIVTKVKKGIDMENKKVEVCANCSGFDVKELKNVEKAKIGCIGKCSKKCPELNGKIYGFLNGEFTVCDTKEEFFYKIKELSSYVETSNMNPLVDAFLELTKMWVDEFKLLRKIVLDCGLIEELKWGQPCYTYDGGNVLILGGFKEYIALSFFKGALLKDSENILVQQTENVQASRQLRFIGTDKIKHLETTIKAYILEAVQIEKAGLKVPVEKKQELEIPEELQIKFDESTIFKEAFYALTPGRQRGYLFHFNGAKQSKTREARIEKFMLKILEGKGLDD